LNKVVFDLTSGHGRDGYKLLTGLIVPRPIGWVGTVRTDGTYNLAPFSFFNVVSSDPPTVLFSGGRHADRPKDSVTFAEERGVFTVNVVSAELAEAMSATAATFGPDDDEFDIAGLTAVPGKVVEAPLVAEAPANLECRVARIVDLGESVSTRVVFGEVLAIHVRGDALDGTRVDPGVIDAIGRMSGNTYTHTRDRFEVIRPR
jgi:flavin reductase (DIM6/NTAB) family NADH-FMN oxidoreductase RutF